MIAALPQLLRGDPTADAAVPPSGATGHLTIWSTAAMALLAVIALMLALAGGRLAERWAGALQTAATLELPANTAAQSERALTVLRQTPGILSARLQDPAQTRALVAQWLTDRAALDGLPLPTLIEVAEAPDFDPTGLRARLAAEVPSAIYHQHTPAQTGVASAADRLRLLALGLVLLTFGVSAVVVTIAARASLAMNAQVITVLRQLGATDRYIARAFVRRFTLRGLLGATLGTALGVVLILILASGPAGALLVSLRPTSLTGWTSALAIPPATGLLAFLATRRAAFRVLARSR